MHVVLFIYKTLPATVYNELVTNYNTLRQGEESMAKRRWITMTWVLLLSVSIVACSSNANNGGNTNNTPPASQNNGGNSNEGVPESAGLPMEGGKYSPEVTLTTVKSVAPNIKFRDGESIEDNIYTRTVKEQLGINLDILWSAPSTQDAFGTKMMLSLSSGEELPDVVTVPSAIAHELIDSGHFQPVGELFEKYAGEAWKMAASQAEEDWLPYMRDGEHYAIPVLDYKYENDPVMFIRQDWLDELNLKAPTTISELEQVMDAFVTGDPDGNGKDDTVGISIPLKRYVPSLIYKAQPWARTDWIFGAHGSSPGFWETDADGNVVYGSTKPETKDGLATLREWMDKGYLHTEAGLHDESKAAELYTTGKSGIIVGPTWLHGWPLNALAKVEPDGVTEAYAVPTGDDGTTQITGRLSHYNVTLINKKMEHPEIYFALQNFFYEEFADPKEGGMFEYGFAEGYDYAMVDGKPVYTEEEIPGGIANVKLYAMDPQIARIPDLQIKTLSALADGQEPQTPFEMKVAAGAGSKEIALKAAQIVLEGDKHLIHNAYLGAPTESMKKHQDLLLKMEQDTFSKIIYGDLPLDAFDDFVKDFQQKGAEDITAEVQAWYDQNVK